MGEIIPEKRSKNGVKLKLMGRSREKREEKNWEKINRSEKNQQKEQKKMMKNG